MEKQIERTLFFIKPLIMPARNGAIIDNRATAVDIIDFLESRLMESGDFERILSIRTPRMPEEFYRDFYSQLEKNWSYLLKKMAADFAGKSLAVFIYQGPDIIQRIRDIIGPTLYKDNIGKGTIREIYGNQEMWYRTVVHASDHDGKRKDFRVFKKWNLIPGYL